jgi:hypothetical protein
MAYFHPLNYIRMKSILCLSAMLAIYSAAAQTDTLPDKNNPAKQVASPDAGVVDKTPAAQKTAYRIEPEKNAETVQKIRQRTAERNQKDIKKYKGKKSNTTKTQ